jgi:hypothetical protein
MPSSNTTAASERGRGNHGGRRARLSGQHLGDGCRKTAPVAMHSVATCRKGRAVMPTHRWYEARLRCSHGPAISGDGRRRDGVDEQCWTRAETHLRKRKKKQPEQNASYLENCRLGALLLAARISGLFERPTLNHEAMGCTVDERWSHGRRRYLMMEKGARKLGGAVERHVQSAHRDTPCQLPHSPARPPTHRCNH